MSSPSSFPALVTRRHQVFNYSKLTLEVQDAASLNPSPQLRSFAYKRHRVASRIYIERTRRRVKTIVLFSCLLLPAIPRIYELMRLRRRDPPWEVVDSKVVQPVPMFYDDEGMSSYSVVFDYAIYDCSQI